MSSPIWVIQASTPISQHDIYEIAIPRRKTLRENEIFTSKALPDGNLQMKMCCEESDHASSPLTSDLLDQHLTSANTPPLFHPKYANASSCVDQLAIGIVDTALMRTVGEAEDIRICSAAPGSATSAHFWTWGPQQ